MRTSVDVVVLVTVANSRTLELLVDVKVCVGSVDICVDDTLAVNVTDVDVTDVVVISDVATVADSEVDKTVMTLVVTLVAVTSMQDDELDEHISGKSPLSGNQTGRGQRRRIFPK